MLDVWFPCTRHNAVAHALWIFVAESAKVATKVILI